MTVLCPAYRATPTAGGQIRLEIEDPTPVVEQPVSSVDPNSNAVLRIPEIAVKLKTHAKTVQKWSRRGKNPLPLVRIPGQRPHIVESTLYRWVTGAPTLMQVAATAALFGRRQ